MLVNDLLCMWASAVLPGIPSGISALQYNHACDPLLSALSYITFLWHTTANTAALFLYLSSAPRPTLDDSLAGRRGTRVSVPSRQMR